jgi:hypothetical protein
MRKEAGKYASEETQRFGAGRFWPTWLILIEKPGGDGGEGYNL